MTQRLLHKNPSHHFLILLLLVTITLVLLAACKTASSEVKPSETVAPEEDKAKPGQDDDMIGTDMDEDYDHDTALREFTPNNGAVVLITAPADKAQFKVGDPVPVIITTTDFPIGEAGNHWHIYLDGSPTMVMGGSTYVLQNLTPGQHEIEVFLSNGDHQDLEQGDKVTIMVEE